MTLTYDALLENYLTELENSLDNPPFAQQDYAQERKATPVFALTRHLLEAGTIDTDGIRHSTKVAWRALANLQKEIENEKNL